MKQSSRETLTVLVVTRNQRDYIGQAIESVHMQQGVEIDRLVISDDCSTDGTPDVAREVLERLGMPGEVRESAEQMGISPHYEMLIGALDTDLVAMLEGDDWWFDRTKLARQVQLLHDYPSASACALAYLLYDESTTTMVSRTCTSQLRILGTAELISGGDGFGFSNMLYRTGPLTRVPKAFFGLRSYDWIMNILVSREGPVLQLDVPGVVHRISSAGTWAGLDQIGQLEMLAEAIDSYIPHADEHTGSLLAAKGAEVRDVLAQLKAPAAEPAAPQPVTVRRRIKSAAKGFIWPPP